MAEIDGEEHFAGHDVAAVRPVLDQAHGADGVGRCSRAMASIRSMMRAAQTSAFLRAEIGVVPAWLPGRPRLRTRPRLYAVTMPIAFCLPFQDRPLLDVQLEHPPETPPPASFAAIADAVELGAQRLAIAVGTQYA